MVAVVGLAYTWESSGVLTVLGFSSFLTEAFALPTSKLNIDTISDL